MSSNTNTCIRKLTPPEVHDAWLLEIKGFPIDEAESLDGYELRQRVAPDLFWGYFENSRMIGVTCATRSSGKKLTHDSMNTHDPEGNLVCVHALIVDQEFRRKGIATTLMKRFLEYVHENLSGVTKVCLLSHDNLIPFYERLGYQCKGPSKVVHGQDNRCALETRLKMHPYWKLQWETFETLGAADLPAHFTH